MAPPWAFPSIRSWRHSVARRRWHNIHLWLPTLLRSQCNIGKYQEITAEWLFAVINQYRSLKELSLVKEPDDLISCEIAEKKSSKGRLSSTYVIDIKFKVIVILKEALPSLNIS